MHFKLRKKNTIWWCSPIIANKIRRTKKNRQTDGMMKKYKTTTNSWFKSFGAMCRVSNPCCYNTTPLHSADQCLRRRLKLFMWLLPLILGIGLTAARLAAGIWCMLLDMPRIISKGSRKKKMSIEANSDVLKFTEKHFTYSFRINWMAVLLWCL